MMIRENVQVKSEPGCLTTPEIAHIATLVRALREAEIELGEEVVVVGEGDPTELVAELARRAGAIAVRVIAPCDRSARPDADADVLIHLADATSLSDALALVRNQGRVLVLSGDGIGRVDFDVYPDLHKRSIRLISPTQAMPLSSQELAFAQHISTAWALSRDNGSCRP